MLRIVLCALLGLICCVCSAEKASSAGDLCGVAAYFNPSRYATKKRNYNIFRSSLQKQGVKLVVAELALDSDPFEIKEEDADMIVRLREDRSSAVMWQKERLINVGVSAMMRDQAWKWCTKIAWLDADVIFDNDDWAKHASSVLTRYIIAQPFMFLIRLPEGVVDKKQAAQLGTKRGKGEGEKYKGIAATVYAGGPRRRIMDSPRAHGYTGFAWVARRSLFEQIGLYDASICGGGDVLISQAMWGHFAQYRQGYLGVEYKPYYYAGRFTGASAEHYNNWATKFYARVDGKVGFVMGKAFHLWHGEKRNRQYRSRFLTLMNNGFDPSQDIRISSSGAWVWASDKPEMHGSIISYFNSRQEDGTPQHHEEEL